MSLQTPDTDLQSFRNLHHAITLVGMSGIGKTVLSTALRHNGHWYHYSADYRIGTRYLSEDILDNIKYKIMNMNDPFVANLLRSDSIYINQNISVDNLAPVSTFLGMFGDAGAGGLDKQTFLHRQDLYRRAEIESMMDVDHFIDKAWRLYQCKNFINDASGSLCEICEPMQQDDKVMTTLQQQSLILYIQPDDGHEEVLKERARLYPKPLYYTPEFINPQLQGKPDNGSGVDPLEFARPLFPDLLDYRKPRYEGIAENFGFTIKLEDLYQSSSEENMDLPSSEEFLDNVFKVISAQSETSERSRNNFQIYLDSCEKRRQLRETNV